MQTPAVRNQKKSSSGMKRTKYPESFSNDQVEATQPGVINSGMPKKASVSTIPSRPLNAALASRSGRRTSIHSVARPKARMVAVNECMPSSSVLPKNIAQMESAI